MQYPYILKFDIAAPPDWSYAAGDTIIGNVVRHAPIVAPEATVELVMTGRIKVKIKEDNRSDFDAYRDEYLLIGTRPAVIFKGPLHLPEGSGETLSWPFEFKIPEKAAESARKGHEQVSSFLPLDKWDPAHDVLPGTFSSWKASFSCTSECKVEYLLKATLRYQFGGHKSHEIVWNVQMRHPTLEAYIRPVSLKKLSAQRRIYSQRLLPGMENADLSFKQNMRKLFGSSKVPELFYKVELTVPDVIQLDDPQPLPVTLNILPVLDKTSDCIREVPREFQINWIKMFIGTYTMIQAPGHYQTHYSHTDQHTDNVALHLERLFKRLESPLVISAGKANEPIHIGNVFQLVLNSNGLKAGKQQIHASHRIHPNFTTYNIKHSHSQEWVVSVTSAGETQEHNLKGPLWINSGL